MINKFCGTGSAAIYGVAYSIGLMLNIVMTAINSSYTPWFLPVHGQKGVSKNFKAGNCLSGFIRRRQSFACNLRPGNYPDYGAGFLL